MPFIDHSKAPVSEPFRNFKMKAIATKDTGAAALTVNEVTIEPGGGIQLHIHPTHEECFMVVEGTIEARLGDEVRSVPAGNTILAPAGVKHNLVNKSNRPAKVITIFPTTSPQRQFLE